MEARNKAALTSPPSPKGLNNQEVTMAAKKAAAKKPAKKAPAKKAK
jgi:hypothetical protein